MEEKLIEAVRPHNILYNTSHTDYMKSKLKNNLWDKIAEDLELKNGELAKDTWTKLRSCHRDALRRQKKSFKSGAAAETIKQWKYQKQMQFLLPYMTNRNREANLVDSGDEDSSTIAQNEIVDVDEVSEISENNYQESLALENENDVSNRNDENIDIVFKEPQKKKINKNNISNLIQQSILNREQRAKTRAIERKKLEDSKPHADPLYHFFMSMYHTTQKLPPATQLTVKNKIFETVSQAEAALLKIPNTSFQHHFDGSPQSTTTWQYVEDSSGSHASFTSNNSMDTQSGENRNDLTNYYNNFQT